MSTGAIIAIVAGAIVLVAVLVLLTRAARGRRLESRREDAAELRQRAAARERSAADARAAADEESARAQRVRAEADEKAAQARRNEIAAQERAGDAERETLVAREHHDRAREIDPDASDTGEDEARRINEQGDDPTRP